MKLKLWLPDGPIAVADDVFWGVLRPGHSYHRPACFVAIDAGVGIPSDTYHKADLKVSQYEWSWGNGKGRKTGMNNTALLPLEVDE